MTDQARYRIVCADGTGVAYFPDDEAEVRSVAALWDSYLPCGPHTVEPVEPEQAR